MPQLPGPDRTVVAPFAIFPPRDPDGQKLSRVLGVNLVGDLENTPDGFLGGQIGIVFASHVCLYPL